MQIVVKHARYREKFKKKKYIMGKGDTGEHICHNIYINDSDNGKS